MVPVWIVGPDDDAVRFPLKGAARDERFLFLDCGAWMGDGETQPAQRDFALVCGSSAVALCEFAPGDVIEPLQGDSPETSALNRALAVLAGSSALRRRP